MYEARGFAEAKQKAGGNRFDDQSHWSKNQKHVRCLDIKRLKGPKMLNSVAESNFQYGWLATGHVLGENPAADP